MEFRLSVISFAVLSLMVIWLFVQSVLNSLHLGFGSLTLVKVVVLLLLVHRLRLEWVAVRNARGALLENPMFGPEGIGQFMAVVLGTLGTFFLSHQFGLGAVLAAGAVGITASLQFRKFQVPAYCGAFVGMACNAVFFTYFHILVAGILGGVLFVLGTGVLNGFGGKLGTIAFFGTVGASVLTVSPLQEGTALSLDTALLITVCSVLGAVLTHIMTARAGFGPVFSSGFMGVLGGVMLPYLFLETGGLLAVVFFCASFAGMTAPNRLSGEKAIAVAGLCTALFFVYSFPLFAGSGGKLGTIAFGSTIAVAGALDVRDRVWAWLEGSRDQSRQPEREAA